MGTVIIVKRGARGLTFPLSMRDTQTALSTVVSDQILTFLSIFTWKPGILMFSSSRCLALLPRPSQGPERHGPRTELCSSEPPGGSGKEAFQGRNGPSSCGL